MKTEIIVSTMTLALLFPVSGYSDSVQLQQATATFSQTEWSGPHGVATAIDGATCGEVECGGWAIYPNNTNQTAVFETSSDVGFTEGTLLTFTLFQTWFESGHTLGRFRLSVTTDARGTFADGLATDGDVSATWTVLTPSSLTATNGTTLTVQPDLSILASGDNPGTDIYTITAITSLTNITGIRLEALKDPSLPSNGPGHYGNGNFVLSELKLDASVSRPEMRTVVAGIRLSEVEISWLSRSNYTYEVDYRSDLTTNTWAPLFTNIVGNGTTNLVFDKIARGRPQRFYRVVALPQ